MDRRIIAAWAADVAILLVGGSLTLFPAFFISYAFNDDLGWGDHGFFLAIVLLSAGVWGLLLGLLDTAVLEAPLRVGLGFGALSSIAIHLVVVAAGTAISFVFESQGSVTADQADLPFVALIVMSVLLATAAVRASIRVARPTGVTA